MLVALLLLAGAVGIGLTAYQAGVAQGLVESGQVTAPEGGAIPYAYGWGWHYRPFGFFGFGWLGCLVPLLFFILLFGLLRRGFWGAPWGYRGRWAEGTPSRFEEWHRRAHGEPGSSPSPTRSE
jgi:hypothetical protein